jgi:DmsE family decaheme c-type cytochrome
MSNWLILLTVVTGVFCTGAHAETRQNKFRLKPGGQGKICVTCHVNFEDKLKQPFVHTPVKAGLCSNCHSPHASSHGKMLEAEVNRICFKCHAKIIPAAAVSDHKVVSEGNCVSCHDPHASKNKFNLRESGNELCFGCHAEMGTSVKSAKFQHSPVKSGCLNCHSPHGSAESASLLKKAVPTLCLGCHKSESPIFKKQHMNYPVAKGKCTSCHNPHGSDRAGILFVNVHRPVANRMCNQCHEDAASPTPFATKRPGFELCRACHSTQLNDMFSKNRVHWPLLDKTGCLNCHSPHASTQKSLLKGGLMKVCGQCHADSIERQKRSETKHAPINEGQCTACHSPHASNNVFLFEQSSSIDLCKGCHNYAQHSTHPLGESAIDPRNKNNYVACVSCHGTHGTENKHMLWYPTATDLCVQCHIQYKR